MDSRIKYASDDFWKGWRSRTVIGRASPDWRPFRAVDPHRTSAHLLRMSTIRISDVPDDLHRRLKARAAQAGMSLSD